MRKTERMAPIVEIKMTVVTCKLSVEASRITCPNTDVVLDEDTVPVPAIERRRAPAYEDI